MPDEYVDPNWPPPAPNSTGAEHFSTIHDRLLPDADVDPYWPAPNPSSRFGDELLDGDPSRSSWYPHRGRVIVAAVIAGAVGVGVGAVIVFGLNSSDGETSSASSPSETTGTLSIRAPAEMPPGSVPARAPTSLPPAPSVLESNAGADLIVRTQSGRARCLVGADQVVCQSSGSVDQGNRGFPQAPLDESGMHWFLAVVDASGAFRWDNGNIPGAFPENDHVLAYQQTYSAAGWTVLSTEQGTTFTNRRTGHGMFVSVENVNAF